MKATKFKKRAKLNMKVVALPIAMLFALTLSLIAYGSYVSYKESANVRYAEAATLDLASYQAPSEVAVANDTSSQSNDTEELDDTLLLSGRVDQEEEEETYTVTWFDEAIPLYANNNVNVRTGPDTSYDVVTTLSYGMQVVATGQTDNGWYALDYDGQTVYVIDAYMQDTEPEPLIINTEPVASSSDIIFVGDSRTVGMEYAVKNGDYTWLCEVGKGYYWLKDNIDSIDDYAHEGTKVIINLGVNDLGNASKYIELINSYVDLWESKGMEVYYSAVTPVGDTTVTNEQIETFNSSLKSGLDSRIKWIDSYNYLTQNGFSSSDGLHYNNATYTSLYNYYISVID